jgi:hypothetical protein
MDTDETGNTGSNLHERNDDGLFARVASDMGIQPEVEIMASLLPVITSVT